jgi:hypothetical protein
MRVAIKRNGFIALLISLNFWLLKNMVMAFLSDEGNLYWVLLNKHNLE